MVAQGGDLRGVGDAQHLRVLRQRAQQSAHDVGRGAADSDVGLVQNQTGQGAARGGRDLNGQADAGALAPGSNPAERSRWVFGIGGHEELDCVDTRLVFGFAELNVQRPAAYAEGVHAGANGAFEGAGCRPSLAANAFGQRRKTGPLRAGCGAQVI